MRKLQMAWSRRGFRDRITVVPETVAAPHRMHYRIQETRSVHLSIYWTYSKLIEVYTGGSRGHANHSVLRADSFYDVWEEGTPQFGIAS
jgi:hypothetical protein